jgi:hypothetical protein
MVYNSRDYWVFELHLSSDILKNTKEHNISGTGSENPSMDTDPVSETLCSLEYRMKDEVQKPSNSESVLC